MSTKAKSMHAKPPAHPAIDDRTRETMLIGISQIRPAPWNVHGKEDESSDTFRGLVDSISANGIIHRLLVRRAGDGRFEIVDGHRRFAAACRLAMDPIPCDVIDAGDDEAKILTATANIQRLENDPFLEAELVGRLRDRGMSTGEIAARMGKSEVYVRRRARLLMLTPEWREFAKTHACSLEMLENVASHTPELQDRVAEDEDIGSWDADGVAYGWDDVESSFGSAMRNLDDAPFDTCACASCPSNTACDALLFPWLSDGGGRGRCQDGACFARKWNEMSDGIIAKAKAKGTPAIEVADRWHIPQYWDSAETCDRKHPQAYTYMEGDIRKIRWSVLPERKAGNPAETAAERAARKAERARERAMSAACHRVREAFSGADRKDVARKMRSIFLSDETAFSEAADYFAAKACGYATLAECATLVRVCGGPAQFAQTFLGDAAAFTDAERDALSRQQTEGEV